ncbi:pyrroline-5-carboxylate reductase dimerization-domain-containing protein [Aspergillus cavernicola]|uniref:Pyrroline-5-carboxylate reductase dimerization-domain-containing protein n=1 Tax=Aspergillus cavernicola TaxID=176166 RepID=A0ABR4IZW6_9EURO
MEPGLTLTFVGCGNMGSAVLSGILDASTPTPTPTDSSSSNKKCPFSRIIACTKTKSSANVLQTRYAKHPSPIQLEFQSGDNTFAVTQADVVILACKPYLVESVLGAEGLSDALAGKLVVSIIAGKTREVLAGYIEKNQSESTESQTAIIARAIPNVAASVRESMTIIELPDSAAERDIEVIEWMFSQIGQVKILGLELFDLGTMLMASLASVSVAVDGILDGCVAEGLRRSDAAEMTAQCLLGLARLLKEGHHPALLREAISSPRGCTIQGLLTVEKAGVRSAFAESIINGTRHLQGLQ